MFNRATQPACHHCLPNRFRLLVSLLILLGYLPDVSAQPTRPAIQFSTLTKRIDSIRQAEKTPGVQVLIFTKDSLLYKHNTGLMNLKTKMPVTDESMFRLGSITKSFVAVSTLMLIEKKLLATTD